MNISEVAKRTGVPASTLRYYDDIGLIVSIGRSGLRRVFDTDVLERLALIALGQSAGFSLEEIARMFVGGRGVTIDRKQLTAKADALDATIQRLGAMRDGLRHAARCPAPSHLECPTFQRLLRAAATQTHASRGKRVVPKQCSKRSHVGSEFTT